MLTSQGRVFMGVDRRVVLYRPTLHIPPPRPTRLQLIKLLTTGLGFGHIDFPIATMARKLIGKPYSREARMSDAPNAFTCSTLVKYLYAMRGIWIPRFVEQQYEFGRPVENLHAGDLVFRSATDGSRRCYDEGANGDPCCRTWRASRRARDAARHVQASESVLGWASNRGRLG